MFNVIVWVRSQVCRHSPPHGYEIMIELRIRNVITYTFMSIIIMYVCNLTNVKLMVYIIYKCPHVWQTQWDKFFIRDSRKLVYSVQ